MCSVALKLWLITFAEVMPDHELLGLDVQRGQVISLLDLGRLVAGDLVGFSQSAVVGQARARRR